MAFKRTEFYQVESTDTLSATPEEGEAWRITKIEVSGGSEGDTIEVKIGKTSVFYAPLVFGGRPLFSFSGSDPTYPNLFDFLKSVGKNLVFPVAAGETVTITTSSTVTAIRITYEVFDAGDVSPEEPNGSKATEYTLFSWIANGSAVTDSGWINLNSNKCPAEYPDFPAQAVPSKTTAEIHMVAARPIAASVGDGSSSLGTSYSKYLRLIYRRAVLFDPNRNGWNVLGNSSYSETSTTMSYDYSSSLNDLPVLPVAEGKAMVFEDPLTIPEGEELSVQVYVEHTSGVDIPAGEVQALFLVTFKPVR